MYVSFRSMHVKIVLFFCCMYIQWLMYVCHSAYNIYKVLETGSTLVFGFAFRIKDTKHNIKS